MNQIFLILLPIVATVAVAVGTAWVRWSFKQFQSTMSASIQSSVTDVVNGKLDRQNLKLDSAASKLDTMIESNQRLSARLDAGSDNFRELFQRTAVLEAAVQAITNTD